MESDLSVTKPDLKAIAAAKDAKEGVVPPNPEVKMSKLAQEINDEFLTCKICLDAFRNPKCLDCLHTFCERCIDNHVTSEATYKKYSDYREFTCPLCRKRTHLPLGGVKNLPDNFLVSNLTEVIIRQKPSKFPFCDICKLSNKKHKDASSKCLDCNKLLCKNCVELHRETKVTKTHSIFDCEIEKDIECKEHPEEVVRFYCENCEICICVLCTFNEHQDHEISSFNEAVAKYKENIENLLRNCQDRIEDFESELGSLSSCAKLIEDTEQKIHDVASEFVTQIRNREKLLVEEIHNIYGPNLIELVAKREEMNIKLDGLKSTCNLTEIILKGKDIELLLLKKQVHEKLSSLSDMTITHMPETVKKIIKYIPGSLDTGYVQDMDRPMMKRFKARPSIAAHDDPMLMEYMEPPPTFDAGTQTEEIEEEEPEVPETDEQAVQVLIEEEKAETKDVYTATPFIEREDKAVNTRSRSTRTDSTGTAEEGSSPGLQRRRRRRERNRTDADDVEADDYSSSRRRSDRGSRYYYGGSIDQEDNFYSADNGIVHPILMSREQEQSMAEEGLEEVFRASEQPEQDGKNCDEDLSSVLPDIVPVPVHAPSNDNIPRPEVAVEELKVEDRTYELKNEVCVPEIECQGAASSAAVPCSERIQDNEFEDTLKQPKMTNSLEQLKSSEKLNQTCKSKKKSNRKRKDTEKCLIS